MLLEKNTPSIIISLGTFREHVGEHKGLCRDCGAIIVSSVGSRVVACGGHLRVYQLMRA